MYYYIGKTSKGFCKAHLSNNEKYILDNINEWTSKDVQNTTGNYPGILTYQITYCLIEILPTGKIQLAKISTNLSALKSWVYKKKRQIYPAEYSYRVIQSTCNNYKEEDKLENHNFDYHYDGGDYVVTDNRKVIGRVDTPAEAREFIQEEKERIMGGAD